MTELLGMLTSQLGVDDNQAKGGMGAILNLAKEKLSDGDFSQITNALGGDVGSILGAAPKQESGGIGGMIGAATSALGINTGGLGQLASLAGAFKTLNLDADMIGKFAPIVMGFLKDKGGDGVSQIFEKFMK